MPPKKRGGLRWSIDICPGSRRSPTRRRQDRQPGVPRRTSISGAEVVEPPSCCRAGGEAEVEEHRRDQPPDLPARDVLDAARRSDRGRPWASSRDGSTRRRGHVRTAIASWAVLTKRKTTTQMATRMIVSGRLRKGVRPQVRSRRARSCDSASMPLGLAADRLGRPGRGLEPRVVGIVGKASNSWRAWGRRFSSSTQTPQPSGSWRSRVVTPSVNRWSARCWAARSSVKVPIWREWCAPPAVACERRAGRRRRRDAGVGSIQPTRTPGLSLSILVGRSVERRRKCSVGFAAGRFDRGGCYDEASCRRTDRTDVRTFRTTRGLRHDHGIARGLLRLRPGDPPHREPRPRPRPGGGDSRGGERRSATCSHARGDRRRARTTWRAAGESPSSPSLPRRAIPGRSWRPWAAPRP